MNWISVKDRLPEYDEEVGCEELLFYVPEEGIFYGTYKYKCEFYDDEKINMFWADNHDYDGGDAPIDNVTHWMPLPQPPIN